MSRMSLPSFLKIKLAFFYPSARKNSIAIIHSIPAYHTSFTDTNVFNKNKLNRISRCTVRDGEGSKARGTWVRRTASSRRGDIRPRYAYIALPSRIRNRFSRRVSAVLKTRTRDGGGGENGTFYKFAKTTTI